MLIGMLKASNAGFTDSYSTRRQALFVTSAYNFGDKCNIAILHTQ